MQPIREPDRRMCPRRALSITTTCPGAHLAKTESRILLEEWLQRIPDFAVAPGHEISFTGGIVGSVDGLPLRWKPEG